MKNSSVCTTYIRGDSGVENFWESSPLSYTMNDGDVYIISISNYHAVMQNSNSGRARYILTYNMVNR
jgi:ectoine hydroxylase-related dioxygenase (phytanoyl-CoA dioxygenase family)